MSFIKWLFNKIKPEQNIQYKTYSLKELYITLKKLEERIEFLENRHHTCDVLNRVRDDQVLNRRK